MIVRQFNERLPRESTPLQLGVLIARVPESEALHSSTAKKQGGRIGEREVDLHSQTKLIQFALHILNNLCLEYLPLLENLLHSHPTNNHPGLSLNDSLDDILHMAATRRSGFLPRRSSDSPGQDLGILAQGIKVVIWADGEDGRERELQLLDRHGLEGDFEVEGTDGDAAVLLPCPNPGFLDDLDVLDAAAGDDEVGVGVRDVVTHNDECVVTIDVDSDRILIGLGKIW